MGSVAIGTALIGLGLGVVLGWVLASRRIQAIRRDHAARRAELRNHVLPILEQRASGAGVPPSRRARDVIDPLRASIEIARAIQEVEAKKDLPYTDTLEVSAEAITAEVRKRKRA